jgi:biopolymer transport protein ExbB/TolQ
LDGIVLFFRQGGWFMYIILGIGLFGLAIIVERMIVIFIKNRIDSVAFSNQIIENIQVGNIDGALRVCDRSKAALPQIVRAGLERADEGLQDIQNAIELKAMSIIPKLEKRTGYLSMTANVATLLGLLGTIWGLITSFQAVAHADASQKAALLSSGIAMAMNTTAFGLMVAIPCMVFFAFLHEKTNDLIDEINENVARIFQYFAKTKSKNAEKVYEPKESGWQK